MNKMWVLLLLPLHVEQWFPMSFTSTPPDFVQNSVGWSVHTKQSAGGYVYLFPPERKGSGEGTVMEWEWSVLKFPTAKPVPPYDKRNDDYALRIGALFASGGKGMALPEGMQKILHEKKREVSYAVLYGAIEAKDRQMKCGVSPYQDHIVYCPREAGPAFSKNSAVPASDLVETLKLSDSERERLSLVGAWVFADSDNSKSESLAALKSLGFRSESDRALSTGASKPKESSN